MMSGARTLFARHRRRLSVLVLLAGLFMVGRQLYALVPRTTEVVLDLGPRHTEVVELRLHYLASGEPLRSVRYSHPEGAPERVRDRVQSHAARLVLESVLVLRDGSLRARAHRIATEQQQPVTLDARP